ncbi:MAG: TonB family protein, partial [Bacteroidales bacterium]|nr:TonB family protein [Bacteroidales bacterium]
RELQSLHEYMADRDVVATGIDKQNYMMLILQQCTAVDFSNMSNNFSFLLTKKRIKMITQSKKTKGVVIKALLTLPLFALLLFANCKSIGQNNVANESRTTIKIGEESYVTFADPMEINLDGKDYTLDINSVKNEKTFKLGDHKLFAKNNHDERNSYTVTVDGKPFDLKYLVSMILDDTDVSGDEDEVLKGPIEVMPEYPGGPNALVKYVQNNLKYPESAKKNKQEGRVFVGFVVEKDGSISNVSVMRGVCEELDNEAVRVVKTLPKFTPGMHGGKPVRVQYTLPIAFKLNGESTMTTLSGTNWEGRGIGVMDGVTYDMFMTMSFYDNYDGLFVMKLVSEENGEKAVVFKDVALDFKYTFDGKSTGSIQPKNPDGSDLGEAQPPYGFVVKEKSIVVNFYDFKNDCGIEEITFVKK